MHDRFEDPRTPPADQRCTLDVERLDAYRVALEFQAFAAALRFPRALGHLRDQLDRAATSIALNIAEGVGRCGRRDRARFFLFARGSAMECAAIVDIVRARGLHSTEECNRGRSLLVRTVQMLTQLARR